MSFLKAKTGLDLNTDGIVIVLFSLKQGKEAAQDTAKQCVNEGQKIAEEAIDKGCHAAKEAGDKAIGQMKGGLKKK